MMPQMTILVVDDEEAILTLVKVILKRKGYTVETASNAHEALEMLETLTPDLFILDIMMPHMDGIELCRHIRTRPETAKVPVIMLTALGGLENINRAMEAGANDYIEKASVAQQLVNRVEDFFSPVG
ncbi:MAG: response regulator [Chloroflexi bacterium]|nr:MAG: response regulator [Chloroflexota bacterium]